jgi:hypothetical protein
LFHADNLASLSIISANAEKVKKYVFGRGIATYCAYIIADFATFCSLEKILKNI